jgi:CheY-like chemotaxis protein
MARILVVDDDELVRRSVKAHLEKAGHHVTVAEHGGRALKAVQRDAFDVVVTDIFMPEVEGIETVRRLRALQPDLAIIAVTGGPKVPAGMASGTSGGHQGDYLKAARTFGARSGLRKPFTPSQLLALIDECLADRPDVT